MMTHCFDIVSYSPNSDTVLKHISSNLTLTSTNSILSIYFTPTSGLPLGDRCSGPNDGTNLLNIVRLGWCCWDISNSLRPNLARLVGDRSREFAFRFSLSTRSNSLITARGLQNSARFTCLSSLTTLGASPDEKPITSTGFRSPVSKQNSDFSSIVGEISEGSMEIVVCAMPYQKHTRFNAPQHCLPNDHKSSFPRKHQPISTRSTQC